MTDDFNFDYIIGESSGINGIIEQVKKIAVHHVPVLIEGESGTGKELVARAIHYNSPRREREFVVINCSAFSDSLLESELFGHMKGSFTGAINEKKGLFEVANHGTFFLDEIGDMSPALQVKLLRVVQEGTFLKIGGISPITVDVRIIAASNKSLKKLVEKKEFREDLYYRINVTSITIPPLRERKADIEPLVRHFINEISSRSSHHTLTITDEAIALFQKYSWPGNVRQLENEIEKAMIFAHEGVIDAQVLSPELVSFKPGDEDISLDSGLSLTEIKKRVFERVERKLIYEGLEKTNWNKSECAKLLQVSRGDLMRKIARYSIELMKDE